VAVKLSQETKRREALIARRMGQEMQFASGDLARSRARRSSLTLVDEHGNVRPLVDDEGPRHQASSEDGPSRKSFGSSGPVVNIDGTPMVGDSGVDIHGNPYGVTDHSFGGSDLFGSAHDSFSSSHDSFGGGGSGGFGGMNGF
jgi:hypothetical protein